MSSQPPPPPVHSPTSGGDSDDEDSIPLPPGPVHTSMMEEDDQQQQQPRQLVSTTPQVTSDSEEYSYSGSEMSTPNSNRMPERSMPSQGIPIPVVVPPIPKLDLPLSSSSSTTNNNNITPMSSSTSLPQYGITVSSSPKQPSTPQLNPHHSSNSNSSRSGGGGSLTPAAAGNQSGRSNGELSSGGGGGGMNLAKRSLRLGDELEQQSKYLFQVNEKGFVVSVAASILMEFQQFVEKEFVESVKMIPPQILNDAKEKKRDDFNFSLLFQFRTSENYLKHLKLFKDTTFEKNCQLYCQLILDWLQQPSSTNEVGIPEWSYVKFRARLMQQFNLTGDEKSSVLLQSLDILIWLTASDVLCVILKSYNPSVVDAHVTESMLRYCFTVVIYDTYSNAKLYSIWKQMQDGIIDQWAFVIRRLSRKNLSEVCSFFMVKMNSKTDKGLAKCYMNIMKYVDIDLSENAISTRDLLESLVSLAEKDKIVKTSISLRNALLRVLQTIYLQLDFELEENCNLLEEFNLKIYDIANVFEKSKIGQKGSSKGECMILKSLIVKHAGFAFHNGHAAKVVSEVVEFAQKKKDQIELFNQSLYALCVLMKDKYNVDRNMSPYSFIRGPYQNLLLKYKPFVDVVYSEADKNLAYFTEDQTSKNKYREVMAQVASAVITFLTKMNVTVEAEDFDDTSFLLTLLVMRLASYDVDIVLGKEGIIRKFLQREFQKNSLFSVVAMRVLKIMHNNTKDSFNIDVLACESEMDSIKRQPTYANLLNSIRMEYSYLKKIIEHCSERMDISILQYTDVEYHVIRPEKTMIFVQDESDGESESIMIKPISEKPTEIGDNYSFGSSGAVTDRDMSLITDADHHLNSSSTNFSTPVSPRVRKMTKKGASETDVFKPLMRRKTATVTDFSATLNRYPTVPPPTSPQPNETGSSSPHHHHHHERKKSKKEDKLKKERYGLVKLLIYGLSTIPLFASEDLLMFERLESFVGNYLICGDRNIALSISSAFQETMSEHPNLRSSILRKTTDLFAYHLKQFSEVKSIKFLMKNIIQFLKIWSEDKNGIDRSIDTWIFKLEACCMISMCFVDRQLRLSALECLEVLSNLFYEHVSGLCYRTIVEKQSSIIQRSIRKIEVRDAMGVDEFILNDDLLLKLEKETLVSVSQSETATTVLYTFILAFIGETLAEQNCKMYTELISILKDFCCEVSTVAYEDERFAPLWTDSLCLLVSLCGVPNPEDQNMYAALENYKTLVRGSLKQIDIFDKFMCSDEVWHHRSIVNICSCFNYQALPTLLDMLTSYLDSKKEKKVTINVIIALKDVARILNSFTQTQSFTKLFKYPNIFSQTIRLVSELIQKSYSILSTEKDLKIKDPFQLYCVFHTYANNAATLNNVAKSLYTMKNTTTRQKALKITNALYLRNGNVWHEDSRVHAINSLRECLDKIPQMQQIAEVTVERMKDEKAKEYWRGEYANILTVKLKHICFRAISSILKVDPITTLFANTNFDFQSFFVSAELAGYRMLDALLCHHFEHLLPEFISVIYTTTDDSISEVYVNAIYDNLLPSPTAFSPHYCTNDDRLEWMLMLKGQELFEGAPSFLSEDDLVATTIHKNILPIVLLLLYLLHHPYDSVHSKASEMIMSLVQNNFTLDDLEPRIDLKLKDATMCRLEILDVAMRTNSVTTDYALQISEAVAGLVSFWSNALFAEALKFCTTLAINSRKAFIIQALNPWSKYLELCPIPPPVDVNEVIHIAIKLSIHLQRSIGFIKELHTLWRDLALQGGLLVNPLNLTSTPVLGLDYSSELAFPRNLIMIVDYIKVLLSNAYIHEKDKLEMYNIETVCRGIAVALYSSQPKLTLQLLISDLTTCDDTYGDAVMCLLNDIVCHNEHKIHILEKAHIILSYVLIRMDGSNENAHTLFTSLLLSIISHTASQIHDKKNWLLLVKLLKEKVVTINWVDCLLEHNTDKLTQLELESLVPFTTDQGSISAGYLIKTLVECMEQSVNPLLLDYFAQHALEMATRDTKKLILVHNYLSIFYYILRNSKNITLSRTVLYRVLHCVYTFADANESNFFNSPQQQSLALVNRTCPPTLNNAQDILVDSKVLALDVLHLIITRNASLDYKHVFWTLISILAAVPVAAGSNSSIYIEAIVDCLYELRNNEQCFSKYFLIENEKIVKNELERYIAERGWRGMLYTLAEFIPNKNIQPKILDLLTIYLRASNSHFLDEVPERKLFTSLVILMPYFVSDMDTPECQNLMSSVREELTGALAACFNNTTTITPVDFSNRVCLELVNSFFSNPDYVIHAAEILTNMYLMSSARLRDAILLVVSSFVRFSAKDANAFALLYKLAITSESEVASSFLCEVLNPAIRDFKQLLKYTTEDIQRLNDISKYTPKLAVDPNQSKIMCTRLKFLVEEAFSVCHRGGDPLGPFNIASSESSTYNYKVRNGKLNFNNNTTTSSSNSVQQPVNGIIPKPSSNSTSISPMTFVPVVATANTIAATTTTSSVGSNSSFSLMNKLVNGGGVSSSVVLPDLIPEQQQQQQYGISAFSNSSPLIKVTTTSVASASSSPPVDASTFNYLPDLSQLLYNENYAIYFKDYAQSLSVSTDVIDFCVQAMKYEKATDSIQRSVYAKRIIQQFINDENFTVLPPEEKQKILTKYKENVINPPNILFTEGAAISQTHLLTLYQGFLSSSQGSELSSLIKNHSI
ncbi:hypothetical protein C9374_011005 [Naegleria lovaniensis]|uniref:RGS domain-containing protein n=1 Tax=Naegleria lovaniensis TaxID=51637 RepID=A0AA88GFD2_NAELO|nr:uncharacterized protein C9374_011005 [Naegleria lovaniensis]KAG2374168.1 hypothetical protein C9374_011005 [Naegleria lovaniensis]